MGGFERKKSVIFSFALLMFDFISVIELLSVPFRSALGFVCSENWIESFVNDCRFKLSIVRFLERCIAVVLVGIQLIQDSVSGSKSS